MIERLVLAKEKLDRLSSESIEVFENRLRQILEMRINDRLPGGLGICFYVGLYGREIESIEVRADISGACCLLVGPPNRSYFPMIGVVTHARHNACREAIELLGQYKRHRDAMA